MNDLSVALKCVVLNGNIEKWIEADKATLVATAVKNGAKYIEIDGDLINTFSIVGIFSPIVMADKIRRRNGEWQCEHGKWWERGDKKCTCPTAKVLSQQRTAADAVEKKYGIKN